MANGLPAGYVYDGAGTGTVEDPYVPVTCNQFMWAVSQSPYNREGAHVCVKLIQDFDFSTDPQYKNGITEVFSIACDTLYTDLEESDGVIHGISGLKISAAYFFKSDAVDSSTYTYDQNVQNVKFVNCIWDRQSAPSSRPHWFTNSGKTCNFTNCQFSFLFKYNGQSCCCEPEYGTSVTTGPYFINCSQYIIHSGDVKQDETYRSSGCILSYRRNNCTVELVNAIYLCGDASWGRYFLYGTGISNTTITGNVTLFDVSGSTAYAAVIRQPNNLCVALNIKNGNQRPRSISFDQPQGLSIFDKDIIENSISYSDTANTKFLTTSQMKDKDYLLSIGFLP